MDRKQVNESNYTRGSGKATSTAPSLGHPIWGPHLCQQLQQGPVRTAATELTQDSEKGSRLRGTWVENQSVGRRFSASCPPHPALPCPTLRSLHSHSPPGMLESSRKTLGQPRRAPQWLSSQTSGRSCWSCPLGATKATRTQPTGPPWASSCSRKLVSSPWKS